MPKHASRSVNDPISVVFDFGTTASEPLEVCGAIPADNAQFIYGAISWVMRKGVPHYHPSHTATHITALISQHGALRLPVYASSLDIPPDCISHNDVHGITGIMIQVQNIETVSHGQEMRSGCLMYRVPLLVQSAINDRLDCLNFVVFCQGVEVGRHTVRIAHVELSRPTHAW